MSAQRMNVFCPVETKEGKTFWVRLGVAYTNKDGSINAYLDGLPVNGRLQLRAASDRDDASPNEDQ